MHTTGNPFTSAPTLPRPKGHLHSRSLSRSPARQHARDLDPLLRDLSPTSTLRAFVTDPEEMSPKETDALARSIQTSSVSERALGAKAAQACLDLRAWTREMENWEWAGTFDLPEPARKKMRTHDSKLSLANGGNDEEVEYWGSLPATTVKGYEKRADDIGHSLDQIDVEELKEYVLNSHYRVDSRPSSRDSIGANSTTADMKKLDDYTAVVTATILHALPYLSKLNRLLDIWTIRLIILRSAPVYLRDLNQAKTDLDLAWASIAISQSSHSADDPARFNRQSMQESKSKLESLVGSLGRKLDRFLDNLEGREDSLPDAWIDDFERLEAAYGTWVVQAERKVLENEWRDSIGRTELDAQPTTAVEDVQNGGMTNEISELEDPTLDHDAVRRLSMDPTQILATSQRLATSSEQSSATPGTAKQYGDKSPEDSTPKVNSQPIPVVVASEGARDDSVEPGPSSSRPAFERAPSSSSLSKEEGMGQVAKRRAQFLKDIDQNQSLIKTSKSPVRPFEHASNAFTRLFKKDRSPEQVKPKRTVSNKWTSVNAGDRSVSAERNPLSPVSVASSKLNNASLASSAPSAANSSRTSGVATPEVQPAPKEKERQTVDEPNVNDESHDEPPYHKQDRYCEINEIIHDGEQPSNLSSPFHSPDKAIAPKDWPLASPVDTPQEGNMNEKEGDLPRSSTRDRSDSGPEVDTPDVALQTDVFDRMFIESFPSPPEERPGSARAPATTTARTGSPRRPASLPRNARKHMPEQLKYAGSYLDMVSVNGRRSSVSSRQPNDTSPPAPPVVSSNDHDRTATQDTEHGSSTRSVPQSSRPLKLAIPENEASADEPYRARPHAAKRASTASIEAFPRSQLKTIEVPPMRRRSSVSPAATPPQTPPRSRAPSTADIHTGAEATEGSMTYKGIVSFPTPPPRRASASSRGTPPVSARETPTVLRSLGSSPAKGDANDSPAGDENVSPSAPLNVAMAKRRGKSTLRIENSLPSSPISPPNTMHSRKVEADTFDRHVSEVLETLPGQIRFTSRVGAETPSLRPEARGYHMPRPKTNPRRSSKSGGGMTIAPAEASPKKTSSATEPEVKLYHLTTAGRDEPIKLFVRLVGEGERVMVRVGGGWADLADYLRQYAEHHGSRTVSDGNLEVQAVTSGPVTRKISGPAELNRAKSPIPGSAQGTPRPSSKDSENEWSFHVVSNGRSTPSITGRQTPNPSTTPKSSSGSSRPSTANASRPPSRQGEVGLAGPSSAKKPALPEQKAKWVEGMIERAKQASAEKSNKEEKQKYFGELGKAGGTRRVIFRSSSSQGERAK